MSTKTILLNFLISTTCFSQTGKEIAIMIDKLSSPSDMRNETTMVLTNSKGKSRTNKMISQILNGSEKQITWFKKEQKLNMIETDNEDLVYNSMMEIIND